MYASLRSRFEALFRERSRKISIEGDRALVEFRAVPLSSLQGFADRLEELAGPLPALQWVEVNPYIRRVIFALRPEAGEVDPEVLDAIVEEAERGLPPGQERVPEGRDLPDDELLQLQRWVELIADTGGLGFGLLLRLVPFVPTMLGANAVFLLSIVQSQPRLRARLDARFGSERSDLFLNLAMSFAQGVSRRPMSSFVDIGYRVGVLRELRARQRAFERRRPDLTTVRCDPELEPNAVAPLRPNAAPKGPLEAYSARAWIPASSAFGVSLLTTRSVARATSALFSALPKPARMGRDLFANEVGRALAERGTLVLDPDALKHLDRVDCVLLDGQLLTQARFRVGRVIARGERDEAEIAGLLRALFDAQHPIEVQHHQGYRLGPAPLLHLSLDPESEERADGLAAEGSLVLAMAQGMELIALVEVQISKSVGVEELLHMVAQGGLRVVIASDEPEGLAHLGHDYEVVAAGDQLRGGIRRLQQEGHSVCFISDGPSPALPQADCAVAIFRNKELPPWGAHILCGPGLDELRTLLRACLMSRGVSRQSVNLTLGATAVGTVVSTGVGSTSRRVMFVVNVASLASMVNALRQSAPLHHESVEALPDPTPWHALSSDGVLARLDSRDSGLREVQASRRKRTQEAGPGAVEELGRAIADELLNPLAPLLAAGAGLSALVGSTLDASIVASVGGINAVVGGVQRFRTERAIRKLVHPVEQHVRVVRDGHRRFVQNSELVPGDVIELSAGDIVPADCRILESNGLEVDGSSLTGESLPSEKDARISFEPSIADRRCMLYAGTEIVSGRALCIVVAVGKLVEAERAALASADEPRNESGVEARLRQLMQLTGPVAVAGGLAVVAAGMLRGRRAQDLVASGVSMAVAAIPEGLPVLANAAQLSTAQRLSQKGALVRNARCIEALGRVDVICLDKTGTLTEGQIELHMVSDGERELTLDAIGALSPLDASGRQVLAAALRASSAPRAESVHRDAADTALLEAAARLDVDAREGYPRWHPRSEHPFESARGYHAVVARAENAVLASVKGAPERVLARCSHRELRFVPEGTADADTPPLSHLIELNDDGRQALIDHAADLASRGLRVLAVAERREPPASDDEDEGDSPMRADDLHGLCFRGLLAFRDPARPAARASIAELRKAGIDVVMLTGDHVRTARSIADDIDLLDDRLAMTGGELARLDDDALGERIGHVGVFARVTPAQKVRVVRALQRAGRVVAMVGDGANDAPALRTAEVGIAVGENSSPAARAAADIVFSEAGIEHLLSGVVEARAMWLSVRDAVSILVGGNLGEIAFTVVGGLVSGRPPLNPRQILLVNFLTDVAPAMAVALRRPPQEAYSDLSHQRPEEVLEAPLNREILVRAVSTALGASWAWGIGRLTGTKARASTMALAALVGTQLGQTVLSRGAGQRVIWTSLGSWATLAAIIQTPGLSQLFGCRPIGPVAWGVAMGSSMAASATSVVLSRGERELARWLSEHFGADIEARAIVVEPGDDVDEVAAVPPNRELSAEPA
ncbi:MAG: HAD-IC family P-type ATPase [Myxococcales bacterium]|nr:HAD-IC family P-type ATPase [Myxococcales bacterium]